MKKNMGSWENICENGKKNMNGKKMGEKNDKETLKMRWRKIWESVKTEKENMGKIKTIKKH